jgi:hypothetical protein
MRAIAAAPTTTNAITPIFSHSSGVRSSHPIPDCKTATAGGRPRKNLTRSLLSRFVRITSQAYYSPVRL